MILVLSTPHYGYELVGFVDDHRREELNGSYLGRISELDNILKMNSIDDAVIALPDYKEELVNSIIDTCERYTTNVKIIPQCLKFVSEKYQFTQFGRFPLLSVRNEQINDFNSRIFKRLLDFSMATIILIFVLSWLLPLIALGVKLTSPGPVFF